MEHKYDVFISYSRKDYVDENENVLPDSPVNAILNFLDENKISYWFDKKGLYKGAEFVEVISDAIVESKMMIFLSTTNSNESIYTAGEIFEAIENKKLIIPIKVDDSKYNKKFRILLNPLDYIDYKKADAFSDLLKAIECEKAKIAEQEREAAKKAEELKKREWKEAVKTEILEQAEELNKLKETSKALLDSIYKKMRTIDINQKQCPICGAKTEIDTEYCKTCGWFFPALSSIDGVGIEADKSAIILARSRWESKSCSFEGNEENKRKQLLQEIEQLNNKISLLEKEAQEKCTECKNKQQKEADRKARAEQARLAEEKRKQEEADRKARAEQARLAEQKRKKEAGHDYVDLGLPSGLKWATCNVGANKPEEYGNYYAWGETETKSRYDEDNSRTYGKSMNDISGNASYDAACANWGGTWRLPSKREMEELENKCSWKWITQSGANGYKVTGPNGNSIFLPAAGRCYGSSRGNVGKRGFYWSFTPGENSVSSAYGLDFSSGGHCVGWLSRYGGRTVRPVSE